MTARPIRRNAQTPDRNGKIFYTSTTSLSHISKRAAQKGQKQTRRKNAEANAERKKRGGKCEVNQSKKYM